jgi:hypothetical protein
MVSSKAYASGVMRVKPSLPSVVLSCDATLTATFHKLGVLVDS